MGIIARIEEATSVPRVRWTWEPETDILSGSLAPAAAGEAGSLEVGGHDGSVMVLDLAGGYLAGLDVVVWPEVTTVPGLAPPVAGRTGAVVIHQGSGTVSLELESALAARVSPEEETIHLRIGAPRPASVVQVADHLTIEVDQAGGLAGFWLTGVPPLTEDGDAP